MLKADAAVPNAAVKAAILNAILPQKFSEFSPVSAYPAHKKRRVGEPEGVLQSMVAAGNELLNRNDQEPVECQDFLRIGSALSVSPSEHETAPACQDLDSAQRLVKQLPDPATVFTSDFTDSTVGYACDARDARGVVTFDPITCHPVVRATATRVALIDSSSSLGSSSETLANLTAVGSAALARDTAVMPALCEVASGGKVSNMDVRDALRTEASRIADTHVVRCVCGFSDKDFASTVHPRRTLAQDTLVAHQRGLDGISSTTFLLTVPALLVCGGELLDYAAMASTVASIVGITNPSHGPCNAAAVLAVALRRGIMGGSFAEMAADARAAARVVPANEAAFSSMQRITSSATLRAVQAMGVFLKWGARAASLPPGSDVFQHVCHGIDTVVTSVSSHSMYEGHVIGTVLLALAVAALGPRVGAALIRHYMLPGYNTRHARVSATWRGVVRTWCRPGVVATVGTADHWEQ
jgi:hypothetical protein